MCSINFPTKGKKQKTKPTKRDFYLHSLPIKSRSESLSLKMAKMKLSTLVCKLQQKCFLDGFFKDTQYPTLNCEDKKWLI